MDQAAWRPRLMGGDNGVNLRGARGLGLSMVNGARRRGSGRKSKEYDKGGMVGMGREGVRTKKTVMSLDSDAVRGRMRGK
jgi:hypothetical protein